MVSRREQLVRRNFEAYRDLTWIEDLEPKFRERGIGGNELQAFREEWNEHAELRDWPWWQERRRVLRATDSKTKSWILLTDLTRSVAADGWKKNSGASRMSREIINENLTRLLIGRSSMTTRRRWSDESALAK